MSAIDQGAEIRAWVGDEIGRHCLGEDFRFSVLTSAAITPAGPALQFMIVVQMRSPLLGQQPGLTMVPVTVAQPGEQMIRDAARKALEDLRAWSSQQLSAANGG